MLKKVVFFNFLTLCLTVCLAALAVWTLRIWQPCFSFLLSLCWKWHSSCGTIMGGDISGGGEGEERGARRVEGDEEEKENY